MRRTKLVATLGPATDPPDVLRRLLSAGVNVARVNFSHGDEASHLGRVAVLRSTAAELGLAVAILADLPGPKLRVLLREKRTLEVGQTLRFLQAGTPPEPGDIALTEPEVVADIRPGDRMLLDDGRLRLVAGQLTGGRLEATVSVGGDLLPNKGLNSPRQPLKHPGGDRARPQGARGGR